MSYLREDFANMGSGLIQRGPRSCFHPPQSRATTEGINCTANDSANLATPDPMESSFHEMNDPQMPHAPPLLYFGRGAKKKAPPKASAFGAPPMLPDSFSGPTTGAFLFPKLGDESFLSPSYQEKLPYLPMELASEESSRPPNIAPKRSYPLHLRVAVGTAPH